MYGLATITPPAEEPVAIGHARLHLRIDHTEEDELLQEWIATARQLTESHTGRRWMEQELRLTLADFYPDDCDVIRLPVEPVTAIDAVKYYAADGTLTTLATSGYQSWLEHHPPLVAPAPQVTWPTTQTGRLGAVQVEFTAGYASVGDVPGQAKAAILLCLGHWYEHRGDSDDPNWRPTSLGMPPAAKRLLDSIATGAYL